MRILLVNDYGSLQGGVEVQLAALKDALLARGHVVRVFTSSAGLNSSEFSIADDQCFGTTSPFRTLLQSANPWASSAFKKVLNDFRPDVVHLNVFLTQLSPLILPLLREIPCLYQAHWPRSICPMGTRYKRDGSICQSAAGLICYSGGCLPMRDWAPLMVQMQIWNRWRKSIDRIVAVSEALRIRLEEFGTRDVDVIPYGIPQRLERPPLHDPPTIAFAGRMVPEKGVDVLLKAFRQVLDRIPNARLEIAGDGPAGPSLRALAKDLNLRDSVGFHGRLRNADMESCFAGAWVQAVPSVWEEPFGIVAVEAAMRGTVSVVSDIGGLAEIVIQGKTGFRLAPGDTVALADVLATLLSDRALAEEMGRNGRAYAKRYFSFDRYVDRICETYDQITRKTTVNAVAEPHTVSGE